VALVQGGWDTRDNPKIAPAKQEKGWYAKSPEAQRKEIEKICGTHRSGGSHTTRTPTPQGSRLAQPWTLKDKNDGAADALIKAGAKPKSKPAPVASPEPIAGSCLHCGNDLPRYGLQAGARFCNKAHANAFNYQKAQRDKANKAFKDYQPSKHSERMLDIHRHVAGAMRDSAERCGIAATFTATDGGVLAVHVSPLPLIAPGRGWVQSEGRDGYDMHRIEIVATATNEGTLFEVLCHPEGDVRMAWIEFAGDPGFIPPKPAPPPPLTCRQAILTNRVAEFMTMRKQALVAA
jgi:hypothetical protein